MFETNRAPPLASLISSMEPADFTAAILFSISSKIFASFLTYQPCPHSTNLQLLPYQLRPVLLFIQFLI
ncbi:hypothetical protein BAFK78_G038 (plasmid) [Borreliella afzelii K78]|nr:hypothetical protein BAFK78_G038 [Borreliella afzelii K78]